MKIPDIIGMCLTHLFVFFLMACMVGVPWWMLHGLRESDKERARDRDAQIENFAQYHKDWPVGTLVTHKAGDKKGVIINHKRYLCLVRFLIKEQNISGIDTAAGSGFMGHVKHFKPTIFVEIWCNRDELIQRYDSDFRIGG